MQIQDSIKIYPEILFQARRGHNTPVSAFRLWFLAKDYDRGGSGFIPCKGFRQHLHSLGVSRQTAERWIVQALQLRLIKRERAVFRLASWQGGAGLAGARHLSGPVRIERCLFLKKGWLATCWAAYLLRFEGLISRQTLEGLSGVPARTQQTYERKVGVRNSANFASYGMVFDNPELAIRLYWLPGHYRKNGELRRRLPNSRDCSSVAGISITATGRIRQINRALDFVAGSPEKDLSASQYVRLYCQNHKQTKRSLQKLKRWQGEPTNHPELIYEYVKVHFTRGIYNAIVV